ncbi:MAG: YbbR-like domain-containing protein [Bacteriovoracia bacterium]
MPRFLNTLLSSLGSNLGLKAVSLVVGVILWFVVLGSRNVEIVKDVPIEIVSPATLVVANEVPDKVAFRIAGPKAFLRTILNRREEPIRVNLTNAKAGLFTYRFFSDNIQMPLGVKVVSMNPAAMVVKLEPVKSKEVQVRLVTHGESPLGHKIKRLELVRSTIKVKGPESRMDHLTELFSHPIDLGTLLASGEFEVTLDMEKHPGVSVEGEKPRVQVEVIAETAEFKIRNVPIQVLSNRAFSVSPGEATLVVSGSAEQIKTLDRSKIHVTVDVRRKGAGTHEVAPFAQLPAGVKLIKVFPARARVTLK